MKEVHLLIIPIIHPVINSVSPSILHLKNNFWFVDEFEIKHQKEAIFSKIGVESTVGLC